FNHKQTALVIPLNFIHRVIVDKVTCTIHDGFILVDLDASHDMTGMPKDHIGAFIDQRVRKRNMLCWGVIPPIWSPMCRYDQHIHLLFGPSHHLKKMLSALSL